jgi:hypothetical protein
MIYCYDNFSLSCSFLSLQIPHDLAPVLQALLFISHFLSEKGSYMTMHL